MPGGVAVSGVFSNPAAGMKCIMSDLTTTQDPPPTETEPQPATQTESKTVVATKPHVDTDHRTKKQPPYNVVLLDDNDHTYEYVIRLCRNLFAMSEQKAYLAASEVDNSGRVIQASLRDFSVSGLSLLKHLLGSLFFASLVIDHCVPIPIVGATVVAGPGLQH